MLLLIWSCSAGPKTAGSENAEEPIAAQRQQASEATVSPPNPIRLLRRSGDTLTDDPMAGGEVVEIGFFDPETKELITSVRPANLNPYSNIGKGFKKKKISGYVNEFDIVADQPVGKKRLKPYLPTYLYPKMPEDWQVSYGITTWRSGSNQHDSDNYLPVYYLLEWAPHPERTFMGNYGVTLVTVLDKVGKEIYKRQFDGLLNDVVVSENGEYLSIEYELYPELRTDTSIYRKTASIIRLSDEKTIWKEVTNLFYIEYYTRSFPPNYLLVTKRKRNEADYRTTILNTKNEVLYSRILNVTT